MLGQATADDLADLDDGRIVNAIDGSVPLRPALHDSLLPQMGQVSGDAGLLQTCCVGQVLYGTLSLHQQVEDPDPLRIA